jgi:CHAT domain-containing protein
MELAEQVRAQASGGEREVARTFEQQLAVFECMVQWQTVLGGVECGLEAVERGRARSLLDQMETNGLDILAGMDPKEAEILRTRHRQDQSRILALEKQILVIGQDASFSSEDRRIRQEALREHLRRARDEYARTYAAIRNASPACRLAVGRHRKPVGIDKLSVWVRSQDALLLEYLLGSKDGYVLVIPAERAPRIEKLAASERQAAALGTSAGPLTAERLQEVLDRTDGQGVLQLLREPHKAKENPQTDTRLAALWEVLIPDHERQDILAGKYKRLIIVPDGLLTQLPFETLVVKPGDGPQYLLDAGPPILYAPSATILTNLAEREEASGTSSRPPVLTIGDCQYGRPSARPSEQDLLAELAPGSRYGRLGGHLQPLPHSAKEIRWVSDVFGKQGIDVAWLQQDWATEKTVRYNVSERRIVHLACHGFRRSRRRRPKTIPCRRKRTWVWGPWPWSRASYTTTIRSCRSKSRSPSAAVRAPGRSSAARSSSP